MSKLLLEKIGKVGTGYNALFHFTAAGLEGGKLSIFDDYIEFKLMWLKKTLMISDIDFVEIRAKYDFWFAHHANTWRFLSFWCQPQDRDEIINILQSLQIQIKEEEDQKMKLSPYS